MLLTLGTLDTDTLVDLVPVVPEEMNWDSHCHL